MASASAELGFLEMITAETSLLLRKSDAYAVTQRLSSVGIGSLLVSCSFATTTDAMCWLTSPAAKEAVLAGERQLYVDCVSAASGKGWLALVSLSSTSCFHLDHAGVEGAAVLLRQASPSICVAARFSTAGDARRWSCGAGVRNLIDLLREAAGVSPSAPFVVSS